MKRLLLGCFVATLASIPGSADSKTVMRLEGWIVDSYCGAKNARAEAAAETLACLEKGAKLVFVSGDGTTYDLVDQKQALEHVGHSIRIFGLVDQDRNLEINGFLNEARADQMNARSEAAPASPGFVPSRTALRNYQAQKKAKEEAAKAAAERRGEDAQEPDEADPKPAEETKKPEEDPPAEPQKPAKSEDEDD